MKHLYDEILRRFPEVEAYVHDGDEDLPNLVVAYLVEWLLAVATPALPSDVMKRVVDFDRWCMAQPPGRTAADDIATIEVVSLREKLFRHDSLLPLIPQLMSREELLANGDYLVSWVGADRYEAGLRVARAQWKKQKRRKGDAGV